MQKIKEDGGKKRGRGGEDGDDGGGEEISKYLRSNKGKSSKNTRRK